MSSKSQREREIRKVSSNTRNLVTGRQLGKSAIRALEKNMRSIMNFVKLLETSKDLQTDMEKDGITLGRVIRNMGGSRLEAHVLTFDLTKKSNMNTVPIAGTLRSKGKASTKTDRANCMCGGDVIIIQGGLASGKLSSAIATETHRVFKMWDIPVPGGFFTQGQQMELNETEEESEIEFDRSEEFAEEVNTIGVHKMITASGRSKIEGKVEESVEDDEEISDNEIAKI